jgi:hypothetical protein
MSQIKLTSVDHPDLTPLSISARLRSQLVYFMASTAAQGVPALGENEFWFAPDEVAKWLDEGVFYLVSPLDSANMTEVEITEEQEAMLYWLNRNQIHHVRAVE